MVYVAAPRVGFVAEVSQRAGRGGAGRTLVTRQRVVVIAIFFLLYIINARD
jgi:hypothetical protein